MPSCSTQDRSISCQPHWLLHWLIITSLGSSPSPPPNSSPHTCLTVRAVTLTATHAGRLSRNHVFIFIRPQHGPRELAWCNRCVTVRELNRHLGNVNVTSHNDVIGQVDVTANHFSALYVQRCQVFEGLFIKIQRILQWVHFTCTMLASEVGFVWSLKST